MIEIDDVREALEAPRTEAGDFLSREYLKTLDLSTAPHELSIDHTFRLVSAERRLNRHLGTIAVELEAAGLVETYNDVVDQLNAMNRAAGRASILEPVTPNMTEELPYSEIVCWA